MNEASCSYNEQFRGSCIKHADLADLVIALERRLVWEPPISQEQCDAYFTARTTQQEELHWQHHTPVWRLEHSGGKDLGLIAFCASYDLIELSIDPDPNAQLSLIFLLDFLRGQRAIGVEDEAGPGRRPHRRSWVEKVEKAEVASRPDYPGSSRSGPRCVESLASADTASVV
jgi:hypothetical protein